ncbi:hypothetical protein PENANT_c049G00942 [Penicillium antarcticum]|uniref:G-patch domain-containing protein n=1 Tax=Penicillium antarcticum TaxID=416450 RepID=A0A1V6PRG5_9EURO|nr:uncharacterized protein N7508_003720 [Penicillium antarcticum]KAJ5312890.1 hypothetical protein N7508_003720 [Penicillium antarcticum]OQD79533.1 hypothetical protein PENANT_c049G00942 [Penicillium antarcticum]
MSDEDDYMSMVIEEPTQKETFTQKKRREQREAEARGRVPSKAERAAQEAARRDEALATSTLNPTNKGFQMMARLGFKPGESLGKRAPAPDTEPTFDSDKARSEPLNLIFKENRGGIGLDTAKKRKIREEAEEAVKKVKHEEGTYRDRVREERELKRTEAQVRAAQKVAERLEAEAEGETVTENGDGKKEEKKSTESEDDSSGNAENKSASGAASEKAAPIKPTSQINVLYRGLVREREERDRDRQTRHALQSSLPSSFFPRARLPEYDDPTMDREDKKALGEVDQNTSALEIELEEEDEELDAFNALEPAERLEKLVLFLREKYRYCFWCKYTYETDEELEGCPGLTEEDHD